MHVSPRIRLIPSARLLRGISAWLNSLWRKVRRGTTHKKRATTHQIHGEAALDLLRISHISRTYCTAQSARATGTRPRKGRHVFCMKCAYLPLCAARHTAHERLRGRVVDIDPRRRNALPHFPIDEVAHVELSSGRQYKARTRHAAHGVCRHGRAVGSTGTAGGANHGARCVGCYFYTRSLFNTAAFTREARCATPGCVGLK